MTSSTCCEMCPRTIRGQLLFIITFMIIWYGIKICYFNLTCIQNCFSFPCIDWQIGSWVQFIMKIKMPAMTDNEISRSLSLGGQCVVISVTVGHVSWPQVLAQVRHMGSDLHWHLTQGWHWNTGLPACIGSINFQWEKIIYLVEAELHHMTWKIIIISSNNDLSPVWHIFSHFLFKPLLTYWQLNPKEQHSRKM